MNGTENCDRTDNRNTPATLSQFSVPLLHRPLIQDRFNGLYQQGDIFRDVAFSLDGEPPA